MKPEDYVMLAGMIVACLVIPFAILLWPRYPRRPKNMKARWFLAVLLGWMMMIAVGQFSIVAWEWETKRSDDPTLDDPFLGVAMTFYFGWFYPFFVSIPIVIIADSLERRRLRKAYLLNP